MYYKKKRFRRRRVKNQGGGGRRGVGIWSPPPGRIILSPSKFVFVQSFDSFEV